MTYVLDDGKLREIKEKFEGLKGKVELYLFTGDKEACLYCSEMEELASQIGKLSPLVEVKTGLTLGGEEARRFRVRNHPAMVIKGGNNLIRYFGIPSNLELDPFIDALVLVSAGKARLKSFERVSRIKKPVSLKVFTTPTCPHCPSMVRLAHQLALANDNITVDIFDSMEFPELVHKYQVNSVPRTIINERVDLIGVVSEEEVVNKILESIHTQDYAY